MYTLRSTKSNRKVFASQNTKHKNKTAIIKTQNIKNADNNKTTY